MIRPRPRLARFTTVLAGLLLLTLGGCGRAAVSPPGTGGTASRSSTAIRDKVEPGTVIATARVTPARVTVTAVSDPSPDFAFAFAAIWCGQSDQLDTFAGTFTHFVPDGHYRAGIRTIPASLTPGEMRAVYRQMIAIDLFSYPTTLSLLGTGRFGPAADYNFRVRHNGRTQYVHWTASNSTPTTQEQDLGRLVRTISDILRAYPEVRAVPRGAGCT